jgi:hypothetical protein
MDFTCVETPHRILFFPGWYQGKKSYNDGGKEKRKEKKRKGGCELVLLNISCNLGAD